jgi:hypothetical protein
VPPDFDLCLRASLLASAAMAGLVWFVQIVHYPLFRQIPPEAFRDFHRRHASRTTIVVAPLMLLEVATALTIWFLAPPSLPPWANHLQLGLVAFAWLNTFALMVPLHNRLATAHDPRTINHLILCNLPRTLAWTARTLLLTTLL